MTGEATDMISCLIGAVETTVVGETFATPSFLTLEWAVILPAEMATVVVFFGCVRSVEFFFLVTFLEVVLCCLDLFEPLEVFRFGDGPELDVAFLFVPPGVVTKGILVKAGVGEITKPGERLADETTLVVSTGGAVGSTVGSAFGSWSITERLLNEVEGRNAPNPSSKVPSLSAESSNEGISFMTSSSPFPPPTTAAL